MILNKKLLGFQTIKESFKFVIIICFVLSCLINPAFSSETINYYIFKDKVNLRTKPSLNSKVLTEMSIGEEVEFIEELKKEEKINGISSNWYKVHYKKLEGYIWGGMFAKAVVEDKTNQTKVLIGISSVSEPDLNSGMNDPLKNLEAKLIKNNKLISQIKFKSIDNQSLEYPSIKLEILNKKGFEPAIKLIRLGMPRNCCGCDGGDIILILHNNKLIYGFRTLDLGEAGSWHVNSSIIFPNDKGGKQNQIIVKETSTELENENDKTEKIKSVKYKTFEWKNGKLVQK